jgi:tetratricopeptide (TPR) repeat protein
LTDQALEVAGENALLYATRALIHWQYHNAGYRPTEETMREAGAWADKALALDPDLPQAHAVRGFIDWTSGDLNEAVCDLKRAAELETNSDALGILSVIFSEAGRTAEGRRYGDQAVSIDPWNTWAVMARGWAELQEGRFQDALGWFRRGLDVSPQDPMLAQFEGLATVYAGDTEAACSIFDRMARTNAGLYCEVPRAYMAALRADSAAVQEILAADDVVRWARRDKELSWWMADCLSYAGATGQALEWLSNSIELGIIDHRFWSEIDPLMAPLRREPGFAALMERAKERQRRFVG